MTEHQIIDNKLDKLDNPDYDVDPSIDGDLTDNKSDRKDKSTDIIENKPN